MPLSHEHKIGLLKDLLQSQKDEHFLTSNERDQLHHLLVNLSADPTIDPVSASTISQISSASNSDTLDNSAIDTWLSLL